jgi:hypothetical protein
MSVLALNLPRLPAMPPALRRGLVGGAAWGLALAIGLIVVEAVQCGALCVPDALATLAVAIPAGIVTMGPLVALAR